MRYWVQLFVGLLRDEADGAGFGDSPDSANSGTHVEKKRQPAEKNNYGKKKAAYCPVEFSYLRKVDESRTLVKEQGLLQLRLTALKNIRASERLESFAQHSHKINIVSTEASIYTSSRQGKNCRRVQSPGGRDSAGFIRTCPNARALEGVYCTKT